MIHLDFDDGEVGFLIFADNFGIMLHARRIVLQADADAIGLVDDMAVGDDVTFGVDDYARTEGALTNIGAAVRAAHAALATLAAEEAVEEVIHTAVATAAIVIIGALGTATPVGILDGGFGVDVYDGGA